MSSRPTTPRSFATAGSTPTLDGRIKPARHPNMMLPTTQIRDDQECSMETARIARIIDEMGTLLEVRGENPFRCRAYHNAAQVLKGMPGDLSEAIADGSLAETPGIGETMYAKI